MNLTNRRLLLFETLKGNLYIVNPLKHSVKFEQLIFGIFLDSEKSKYELKAKEMFMKSRDLS